MNLTKTFSFSGLIVFLNISYVATGDTRVKFTNLKCDELYKEFVTFKICKLSVVGRDKVSLHVHAEMHKLPVNNITINAALFKKANSYRPFLYNTTTDFCQFLKNPNPHMFWKIAYSISKPYTNVNHTCPINHDIIFKGMVLDEEMFNKIPFPRGAYMVQLQIAAYNRYNSRVRIYIDRIDE